MKVSHRRLFLVGLALAATIAVSHVWADKPTDPPTRTTDVLSLFADGKIALHITAHGAYRLNVKMQNVSKEAYEVEFPPGLVADAFGQNLVMVQIVPKPIPRPGMTGYKPGGSQGMANLATRKLPLLVNQRAEIDLRTACMNYGLPEPKPTSWLFLKSVEDYTPNQYLQAALKRIPTDALDTAQAQAAIWHLANGVSYESLAKSKMLGGSAFSAVQLARSQDWLKQVIADVEKDRDPVAGTGVAATQSPLLALAINPDPRGTSDIAPLVAQALPLLKTAQPRIAFSHANHPVQAPDMTKPFVQWNVIVQSQPAGAKPGDLSLLFTMSRSEWDPAQKAWRYDDPTTSTVAGEGVTAKKLADQVLSELANRTIAVAATGKKKKLAVASKLSAAVGSVTLRDPTNPLVTVKLTGLNLPAGGQVEADLTTEQAKLLDAANTLVVSGFELRE